MKPSPPSPADWLYGVNPVFEALKAGVVKAVYIAASRQRQADLIKSEASKRGVSVKIIHDPEFFDRKFPKGHQGVAAVVEGQESIDIDDLLSIPATKGEPAFFAALDLLEDPRNFGAVLRSADAAGVHGVLSQKRRATGLTAEAIKASAGAASHVPLCVLSNIKHGIRKMKDSGIMIIGAEAGSDKSPWDVDLTAPLALVIGGEGGGVRRTVGELCDTIISLPMRGQVNSLNASVAAGILMYEVLRQRRRPGK